MSISIRIPPTLHEQLAQRAAKDLRSLNAEIQWLLAIGLETVEQREGPTDEAP